MPTGTVKWFNNAKGYGFILPEEGGEDLFAHYSAIQMEGYKTLKAGQMVAFDVTKGDKGYHATNIISSDSPNAERHQASDQREYRSASESAEASQESSARMTTH
ncbi:cold shock domain-containing protein CspD [Marinimicrobium sp. C2-29]|uniref:cold shock domain-containing protein CspD n=1 Tax=Marinimicrobium sp. C2-29 TaxID=3139825 RepID=UPI003139EA21